MSESVNISQSPTTNTEENEKSMTYAAGSDLVPFDGLTWLQQRFVDYYTGDARGNATKAARLAGYQGSEQTLAVTAYDTLRSPKVIACVRERARQVMGEHETMQSLATYIRQPPSNPIERSAWVKAIELMMKYHGVLTDKVEHSGTVEQQVKQLVVHVTADSKQIGK